MAKPCLANNDVPFQGFHSGDWDSVDKQGPQYSWQDGMLVDPRFKSTRGALDNSGKPSQTHKN